MPRPIKYRGPLDGSLLGSLRSLDHDETTAGLRDLSALPKLGVKGAAAEAWLREQGIEVPPATYDTLGLEDGGLIARLGSADFFLEGSSSEGVVSHLSAELGRFPPQVYRVERQDATFLLAGGRALQVLAELCSVDFQAAPIGRVCLTRLGGVNCAVLPQASDAGPVFRLWADYTWAVALWEILVEVTGERGGRIVS
jgi:sarcosine oxidase subunit gamma